MISKDLTKRLITSVPLILLLLFSFNYSYVLIISLIFVSLISWIEFNGIISKIFIKKNYKYKIYNIFVNCLVIIYLSIFSLLIFSGVSQDNFKLPMLYLFSICIFSDVGGLLFGKVFKGKKLTKISPNKTVSGSLGSFVLSLVLVPIFNSLLDSKFLNLHDLIIIAILVSFFCQLGDLFFSYLKRKAKVKDTGYILPGHGGILDRIDGMLFAIPIGMFLWEFLIIVL